MNNTNIPCADDVALTAAQRETLAAVLDLIVAPSDDGRLPGAAQYDVWGYVCDVAKPLTEQIREQLDRLDADARTQGSESFAALGDVARQTLLERIRACETDFMLDLARKTVEFYYQQDRVLLAIGMEARPPYPLGHQVKVGDLSLLDPVRARGRIYREV